jgi:hypothetical protein
VKPGPNMGKQETRPKGKAKRPSLAPPTSGSGGKSGKTTSAHQRGSSVHRPATRPSGRGAAPWAARHAAKHAAEARQRNAEPPRPGSARATLRTPDEAERIKARIGELHAAMMKIRALRKNLAVNFYEVGQILQQIQDNRLYDAKGYASFEAFAEREIDFGKALTLKLARIPILFQKEAIELGLEALVAALNAIDEATGGGSPQAAPGGNRPALPMKPPPRAGRG